MSVDYKSLQNGSDIRGVALATEGSPVTLGEEETKRLTAAFGKWLSEKTGKPVSRLTIAVGHDSRITAEKLKTAVCQSLSASGVLVYDCGLSSTPAMFMSTIFEDFKCDGAVMITASHLPYNRNGFKYFSKNGGLNKEDIAKIIKTAEGYGHDMPCRGSRPCSKPGSVVKKDLLSTYSAHMRKMIIKQVAGGADRQRPLAGLKIVVDAGNGAGGFYARDILAPLGADISGSRFLEPDGMFPGHEPNPENKEAMESIRQAVIQNKADLGLIFDTDVDRSSAVDQNGREISRNAIVAMAAALIAKEHPGTTVVTDSITSDQLTEYLEQCLGLKHLRYKRGYRNVINKAMELNEHGIDSQLAIETSGHAAYKENYFLDDGAYLATKIVIKLAQIRNAGLAAAGREPSVSGGASESAGQKAPGIDVLLSSLREPAESMEYRFSIEREDFSAYADKVLEYLRQWVLSEEGRKVCASLAQPNYEGVRINFRLPGRDGSHQDADGDRLLEGWCLLRKSLHDPKMPLNIEVTSGSCRQILDIVRQALAGFDLK